MFAKTKILKSIILSRLKKSPYKLNFAITSSCNSRCLTCNVWKNQKPKKDLALDEIERTFKNLPPNITWLSLSGGEPFLRKDLYDICKIAVENIPNLALISIPSNGLLEKKVYETTKRILSLGLNNLFLNFSIDGPEEVHDKIRGAKGSFEKTWNTYLSILDLSKKDPRLSVNIETTVSKYNYRHLEEFFKKLILEKHKITVTIAHTGHLYENLNDENNFTKLNHDKKILANIINIIKSGLSQFSPIDIIQKKYLDNILSYYDHPQKQPLACVATRSSIAISQEGNIIPCFMWGKTMGSLRELNYDLNSYLQKNAREIKEIKRIINEEKCPNCWTPCEAYQSIINDLVEHGPFGI